MAALEASHSVQEPQPEPEAPATAAYPTSSGPLALLQRFWPLIVAVVVLATAGVVLLFR
jgi:hypothetical protein